MLFTVDDAFWELFPGALIGTLVVHGIDNRSSVAACAELLQAQIAATAASLPDEEMSRHPAVAPWRAAYAAFGVKPSKFRSGLEGLLRSAQAGRLRSINPLVDCYNTVSLRHLLPAGGEDLATIQGDVRLTRAGGDEHFVPLGGSAPEPPPAGAVIYRDDAGVICSCWNWREADRTKLTETTRDALLVIEALSPSDHDRLQSALSDLATLVTKHLGGSSSIEIVDRASGSRPEVRLMS